MATRSARAGGMTPRQRPSVVVKKTSPGIDPFDLLPAMLAPDAVVMEYDATLPLTDQVEDADVLLVRDVPVDAAVLAAAPRLQLIQRAGVNVYGVAMDVASARGIPVCNTPREIATGGRAVGEHAACLMLALAKRLVESRVALERGTFGRPATTALEGKRLGMVGVGRTGEKLLAVGKALGMTTAVVTRDASPEAAERLDVDWLRPLADLDDLIATSDVVSLHLPLLTDFVGLIGADELGAMKPGSLLVNTARASLVQRAPLLEAIASGHLGGFGADVWWSEPVDPIDPLLTHPNVIVTPHNGGATMESNTTVYGAVAANIQRVVLRGEDAHHRVG